MTRGHADEAPDEYWALRRALAEWPHLSKPADPIALVREAEHHGLAGVLSDALSNVSVASPLDLREVAREVDHHAHLEMLREIEAAFAGSGLTPVVLKGPLFGERYYPRPSSRVASDTDLLVAEADLERASEVLLGIGYVPADGVHGAQRRREHHHLLFHHPRALPLELHFHAYRGFGRTLSSESLLERSVAVRGFSTLRVLAPADEVVYLAIHAAAHKFGRWSWLFDLRLLIDSLDHATIIAASRRARELGYARPVALAARLLVSIMGMDSARLSALATLGAVRGELAERLLPIPSNPVVRAASRLIYTTLLCADTSTSVRWAGRELLRRARDIVSRPS